MRTITTYRKLGSQDISLSTHGAYSEDYALVIGERPVAIVESDNPKRITMLVDFLSGLENEGYERVRNA